MVFRSPHKIVTNVDKVQLISDVGMSMSHQDAVQPCLGHRGTQVRFNATKGAERSLAD